MSAERIVMLGGGGHARVLAEVLQREGATLHGFIAPTDQDHRLGEIAWLGGDEAFDSLDPSTTLLVNGVGSPSSDPLRSHVHDDAVARGFSFRTVVDPTAIVLGSAVLGAGAQVLPGAIVGAGVSLGADVIVNTGAIIDHDCVIGAHAQIAPGAVLVGNVTVGEGSHVGLGARVLQGVAIGSWSTIGAGAVVLADVPDRSVAVGIPAVTRPS
jgi:sugar O-acyltransferase (sialic acid O-acetyltransferase NeuD family)